MKILVVCQYYYPENFQITPICEKLVEDGYNITVLTGLPNYPTGIVPPNYKKGHRDEIINGVRVIRCNEIGRKKGATYLALNYFSFILSSTHKVLRLGNDYDVVFVYQLSPVFMAFPGMRYARKNHIPLLLYCCDLWPESMKMYIKNENNPIFKTVKFISKKIYNFADRIICQSTSFISYLKHTHNIDDEKLTYIPAFADESYLTQDFSMDNGVVDFVFLGNLGIAQNLIAVLKAVLLIKDVPGFKVHFVGDGSALNDMKQFAKSNRIEDIIVFHGRRPVSEMQYYYKLADACLVSLKADNATGLSLPAKVQGYMAAGKPVIGMINGSARDVIEESNCGICVPAGDINGLALAMKDFIENREKYYLCGQRGRQYFIDNFSKSKFMSKLTNEIKELIGKNVCI